MTNLIRSTLLLLAVSFAGHVAAKAQVPNKADFAEDSKTAPATSTTPNDKQQDLAAETPEISGTVLATGLAVVFGVAAMAPHRRRHSTRIASH